MFNGYNEAPLISYNEFDQGGEKKQNTAPKWSYNHSSGVQAHAQTDYWPNKPNILGIPSPLHIPSKCNCSECYSSETNSYQSDSSRNRTWLPRRVGIPVNGSNESCKLPGTHQWNSIGLSNSESCVIESTVFNSYAQDAGEKNTYHRPFQNTNLPELHQNGVITSVQAFSSSEGHILLKNKNEISSNSTVQEMNFYSQPHSRQPGLCPPTYDLVRNLEKRLDVGCDDNFRDLNDKYSNLNSYRHSNSIPSYPLDSHILRPPTAEPHVKAVPLNLNSNRVPSIDHQNLKENIPKSCMDENLLRYNNSPRKIISSDALKSSSERNERVVFQPSIGKDGMVVGNFRGEPYHSLPSPMASDFKNNQLLVDYSHFTANRDLPKNENGTEAVEIHKKHFEHDRQIDYYSRNHFSDTVKRNSRNSLQEDKKDCILNQINTSIQQYGSLSRLSNQNTSNSKYLDVASSKTSVPVFYPKDSNIEKVLKPDKCDFLQQNPPFVQRNGQNLLKNQNMGLNDRLNQPPLFVTDTQDFRFVDRRPNPFSYSNTPTPCRNILRPQYSYQGCNVSNVSQYSHPFNVNIPINHRNMPQIMPNCKRTSPSSFLHSGNNAFILNPYCQPPPPPNIDKSHPQMFNENNSLTSNGVQLCPELPHLRMENPALDNSSEPKGTGFIETIKTHTLNKNTTSKISPLRLLRKKKLNNQKCDVIRKSPVPKNNTDTVPTLDVRKFWSTWADEEEDVTAPTQVVVLDCQNINPEQAELLQLYESSSIHDLNATDSPKSTGCDKRYVIRPANANAKELGSNEYPAQDNIKTTTGYAFRKDVDESQTDTDKDRVKSKSDNFDEKTSNLFTQMPIKSDANGDAATTHNASLDKNVGDDIKIGESDFVEKVDFLKMAGLSKESDSLENDEVNKIKYDGNEFPFNLDTISGKVKSSEDESRGETENNPIGMDEGKLPEKVDNLGIKPCKRANERKDELPLGRLSPFDDDSLSNSPYSGKCDFPNLPTSEYRRNKFLDYSDGKFIANGGNVDSVEAEKVVKENEGSKGCLRKVVGSANAEKITVNPASNNDASNEKNMKQESLSKDTKTLLEKSPCDELRKTEFQYFKNESVINDLKPKQETSLQCFEMDNILQKLSKINFSSSEVKVEGAANDLKIQAKSDKVTMPMDSCIINKKIKKTKKIENRMDKLTLENISLSKPTIKFSIQKSHDLKILFKVLNNQVGGGKCEKIQINDHLETDRNEMDETRNFTDDPRTNATELITFKLKSIQKDDWNHQDSTTIRPEHRNHYSSFKKKSKHKFKRRKTTENDSHPSKESLIKVKRNKYLKVQGGEKDPLAEAVNHDTDHQPNPKSENCFSADAFQVKESIDLAKIKLTFKRQKGNFLTEYDIGNDLGKDFESEDQSNSSNELSSEGGKSFSGEAPAKASSNLDLLSLEPSGTGFMNSRSESKDVYPAENDLNESTNETNKFVDSSTSHTLSNGKLERSTEKYVKYSEFSSDCQLTHTLPPKKPVDRKDKDGECEIEMCKQFIRDQTQEEVKETICSGVNPNLLDDVSVKSESVLVGSFSKKNPDSVEDQEANKQQTGKILPSCEDNSKLYNKYCMSESPRGCDTSIEHPAQTKLYSGDVNLKNPDDSHNVLLTQEIKYDSLNEPKDSDNNSHKKEGGQLPVITIKSSSAQVSCHDSTSSNFDLETEEVNNKKDNDKQQLLSHIESSSTTTSLQPFQASNWTHCKANEGKYFCNEKAKSMSELVFENNYCSSDLNFEDIMERQKLKEIDVNNCGPAKPDGTRKEESFQWNDSSPKTMAIDPDIPVDHSLFCPDELLPPPSKNPDENSTTLAKPWLDSFSAEDHSDDNENNSFEFIINSSGKIVASDSKRIQTCEAEENVKIDEINDALEAFFHVSEKNCGEIKNATPFSKNLSQRKSEPRKEKIAEKQKQSNVENFNPNTVERKDEFPLEVSNPNSGESDSNVLHEDEVKHQNEITDSKCDSVTSQSEGKSQVLGEQPSEKNETPNNCDKKPHLYKSVQLTDIDMDKEILHENLQGRGKSTTDSENWPLSQQSIDSIQQTMNSCKTDIITSVDEENKNIFKPKQHLEIESVKVDDQEKQERTVTTENKSVELNIYFSVPRKIVRRHSMIVENKNKGNCSMSDDRQRCLYRSKSVSKIQFTYSQWKSRCLKAKSCPPLDYNIKDDAELKIPILDIPIEDIPLPPGDPPPENCFNFIRHLKKRKLSSLQQPDKTEPLDSSNSKIMRVTPVHNLPKRENKITVECSETNNNEYILKDEISHILGSDNFQTNGCDSPQCLWPSSVRFSEKTEVLSMSEKVSEIGTASKDFYGLNLNNIEVTETKQTNNNPPAISSTEVQNSRLSSIVKSECDNKCSNSQCGVLRKVETPSESNSKHLHLNEKCALASKKNENKFSLNEEGQLDKREFTAIMHDESKFDDNSNKSWTPGTSTLENDNLLKSGPNLRLTFVKNNLKLTCDDIELEGSETIFYDKVDFLDAGSSSETSFRNDTLMKDGFYECEDIPTSEDLPHANIEMEKVSDDAKFRHMMQNCLDNAKKFLNVSNLKLFSCSVDDLLELDCSPTSGTLDEKVAEKSSDDSTNHIPRDVLLTPCDDVVSYDLDLCQKFPPSELSLDFVPSFTTENPHNLCPEVLPLDNWPYLEEEVPSSPVKSNVEEADLIPFLENPTNKTTWLQKKPHSKIIREALNNIIKKKSFSTSHSNIGFKKIRRKSLHAGDQTEFNINTKICEKRRKTMDDYGEIHVSQHQKVKEIKNKSKETVTELKNGFRETEHFEETKSLKCRLNLNRLLDNQQKKLKCKNIENSFNGNEKANQSIFQHKQSKNGEWANRRGSIGSESNEETLTKFKLSPDYNGPKWQPKVVLIRIPKRQIRKYQSRNRLETKDANGNNKVTGKHSADERERISQDIVRVLESHDVLSASSLKNQSTFLNPGSTEKLSEQSIPDKSVEKTNELVLEKKIHRGYSQKKGDSDLKESNSIETRDHINHFKTATPDKILLNLNKTSNAQEGHNSKTLFKNQENFKHRKSRFRNLHDKKKSNSKDKCAIIEDSSKKLTMSDAERRLSEIFKDCIDSTERISNCENSELSLGGEKYKNSKSRKHLLTGDKILDISQKKRRNGERENISHQNSDSYLNSVTTKTTTQIPQLDIIKKQRESLDRKHNKSHGEKSSELSEPNKKENCRTSKHSKESHRNDCRSHAKEDRKKYEALKEQKFLHNPKHSKNKIRSVPPNCVSADTNLEDNNDQEHKRSSDPKRLATEVRTEDDGQEKPWTCEVCGFNNAKERIGHIKSHPFHCQSCHLAFKTEAHFVDHLTKKHKDIRNQHHCLLCELSFDTEKEYQQHLETREHIHLDTVEKNTINTLFTLLTGQPCPVFGLVELRPEWLPSQAGTVHFYHQATPLSLALQYLKVHHDLSSYSKDSSSHST